MRQMCGKSTIGLVLHNLKADDYGRPHNALVICTFWYIDALDKLGRTDEAREMVESHARSS